MPFCFSFSVFKTAIVFVYKDCSKQKKKIVSAFVAPLFFYYALRELQRGQHKSGPDSKITVNASTVSLCALLCVPLQ